jgi:hypothetical protein
MEIFFKKIIKSAISLLHPCNGCDTIQMNQAGATPRKGKGNGNGAGASVF